MTQKELVAIIDEEPELPDPMPEEMYKVICSSKEMAEECMRIVVRVTKENIRKRVTAALGKKAGSDCDQVEEVQS